MKRILPEHNVIIKIIQKTGPQVYGWVDKDINAETLRQYGIFIMENGLVRRRSGIGNKRKE
jgi:hypothetical protein